MFYSDHLSSDLIFIKVRSIVYAVQHMAERKRKNDGGGEKLLLSPKANAISPKGDQAYPFGQRHLKGS